MMRKCKAVCRRWRSLRHKWGGQPAQPREAGGLDIPQSSALNDAKVQSSLQALAQQPQAGGLAVIKNGLNGGELAPEMLARYDLPRYQLGCEKVLNMIPLVSGGLTKRPGFRYISDAGVVGDGAQTRLLPFVYSSEVQMLLLFVCSDRSEVAMVFAQDRDGAAPPRAAGGLGMPYQGEHLQELCFAQCGKVLYIAHPNYPPAKLTLDDQGLYFNYSVLPFANNVPVPSIASLEIVGIPNESWGWRRYKVTAVDGEGRESLPSEMQELPTSALSSVFKCRITINPSPGCSEHRIYKQRGNEWGFIGRIVGNETQFDDEGYAPDTLDPPPVRQRFFDGRGEYPTIVFLHQQRLGWAASDNKPLTIWMSQTSNFECLEAKTPPNDDDGIEVTLASTQANRILWCTSDRAGLAIGTSGEEWYLTGAGGEQAITPKSLSFQPQTRYGSQPGLPPLRANSSLLFVQNGGRAIRDLGYSFSADKYEAQDLSLLARHVFRFSKVADWCWQGTPLNILWCILNTGKLLGLTYMPEHEVAAWHRHETQGRFISCATLMDSQARSRLWVIVKRQEGYNLEILDPVFEGQPDEWDAQAQLPQPAHLDGPNLHEFKARCIPCLPEVGMENGATTLRVKKLNAIKLRVINSMPFQARITSQNSAETELLPVPAKSPSPNDKLSMRQYAAQADWSSPLGAGFRDGAKLELVMDGPDPVTILGLAVTMEVASQNGGQV